jgi:hypothetical protein
MKATQRILLTKRGEEPAWVLEITKDANKGTVTIEQRRKRDNEDL